MLCAVSQDRLQRRDVNLGVWCDRVGASGVELFEGVGGVTGEHHVPTGVVDTDHGQVAGRVPGGRDGDDPPVIAEVPAGGKRSKWPPWSANGSGANPGGSG